MATKILIPTPLRAYTNKHDVVEVKGETVGDLLQSLTGEYAALRKHLFTDDGLLRSFVNIYVNDEDIRYLQRENTKVATTDVVSIIPSIAGGHSDA